MADSKLADTASFIKLINEALRISTSLLAILAE